MQDAYAHCEALVRDADKDRFLASLFAPADRRPHLFALYGFNVEIARVGEVTHEPLAGEIRLQWWRDALSSRASGDAAANPVAAALLDTIARCGLPVAPLDALIDARARDLYDDPVVTVSELEAYGRATASTLFGMAARILVCGAALDDLADPAGVAYALAGLLKAFPQHAARGQLYVPVQTLERHGVARAEVIAGTAGAGLRAALAEIASEARERLAQAARHWPSVPPAARPAFLPLAWVAPLLARIERNPDPFVPIDLPQWRRQWLLWRAARRGVF
ncbi:MAG TPA: phytoene/squalene synthase family protein [Xanthobacteraceae bacterium]|jgi:phytoene synthase|nr:phytoene/squalene synthase family protein [Xanthobacteraceae bacterium]